MHTLHLFLVPFFVLPSALVAAIPAPPFLNQSSFDDAALQARMDPPKGMLTCGLSYIPKNVDHKALSELYQVEITMGLGSPEDRYGNELAARFISKPLADGCEISALGLMDLDMKTEAEAVFRPKRVNPMLYKRPEPGSYWDRKLYGHSAWKLRADLQKLEKLLV